MELVLVTRVNPNLRRKLGLAFACMVLSLLTQIALVVLLCLVLPDAEHRGQCWGVIAGAGTPERSGKVDGTWVFLIRGPSPSQCVPDADRPTAFVHSRPCVWTVFRHASADSGWIDTFRTVEIMAREVPTWAREGVETPPEPEFIDRRGSIHDIAFGWPFPAFAARFEVRARPEDVRTRDAIFVSRPNRAAPGGLRQPLGFLPTRVLWPGLTADLGLVAGLWASPLAVAAAVRAWRGRRRVRRGLCRRCGYGPWTGDAECPECGVARPDGVAAVLRVR